MFRKLVLALCATALVGVPAFGQTADELIEKNMKAYGGADWQTTIKALKTMRLTGKIKIGAIEAPVTMSRARPDLVRIDFTFRGMTATQAFDGRTGWSVMPFTGKKDPEKMSEEKSMDMKEDADFDGPMYDYRAKGYEVELLGKVSVQGTPAYKLKVTTKSGSETTIYLDADTYLEIREDRKRTLEGQEIVTETNIGNYKAVEGILLPTRIELTAKGRTLQTITIDKIELNPTFEAMAFAMPGDREAINPSSNSAAPAVYKAKCAACHGLDGAGQTPVGKMLKVRDLRSDEVRNSETDMIATISDGKGKMPAYKGKLSPVEISGLVDLIRNQKIDNPSSNDTPSSIEADTQASEQVEGDESEKPLTAEAIAKLTGGSPDDQSGDREAGSAHNKKQQKALTNDDVIKLVKAELGDQVVIDKIKTSPGDKLDTSTDALIRLKKAGVSKAVIDAMIKRGDE